MSAKYLRWTMPGGEVASLMICDPSRATEDYSVVDAYSSQNQLRHALSVLQRTLFGGQPALPDLWEVMVTYDANMRQYRLWTYTRNWQSRSSFLAGILVGKAHRWQRLKRKRHRQRIVVA